MEGPRLDKRSLSDDEQSTQFITQETPHEPAPSAAPPNKSRALPYVALVAVQLSTCGWHVLGKIALTGGTNPFVLALYRQAGACACLAALARCADFPRGGLVRAALAVSARDRRRFLALGCLGFGNIFGFVVALSYVTAFNSALLHPVIPVIAAAAAAASGVERLTSRVAFGVGLAAAGALVVVVFGVSGGGGGEANAGASSASVALGNVILLGQCVCMGCLLVLQKALIESTRLPPTTTTLFYNLIAAAIALVATPLLVGDDAGAYVFASWAPVAATLYGAVFGLCFVYVVLGWATALTSPTVVSLSMTLQPPLNALLSVLFMGRRSFTAGEVAGGVLISAGLAVTVLGRRRDRVADAADDAPPENPFDDEPRRGDDLGVPLTEVV